ncbi:MAG: hypothetical protein ABEJ65_01550 [bacterium]
MSEEEIPEAAPKSDLDSEVELTVDGGTLVWKDPVASGTPVTGSNFIPAFIMGLITVGVGWTVGQITPALVFALIWLFFAEITIRK